MIIDALIENIWASYDENKNGFLDKKETQRFIENYMEMMGFESSLDNLTFQLMFNEVDRDGSE